MSQALSARSPRGPRPPLRRLGVLLGVWAVLVAGALLVANGLDSPVGEGARDEAQPAALGPVATATTPTAPTAPTAPGVGSLPPFAMVIDHALPAGVAGLAPAEQAERLRTLAMRTRNPARFVELGSVMQVLGDRESAEFSYRSALKFDPQSIGAKVGLAVIDGGSGPEGLTRSASRLEALAADHPRDQLVSFNQAWVAIYRQRGREARAALERTVGLGRDTRLGRTSSALLVAIDTIELDPTP